MGTQENLDFIQGRQENPLIRNKKLINVSAFFDPSMREMLEPAVLTWLRQHSPATEVRWRALLNRDWLKEWKKHFKTFRVAGLTIQPSWEKSKKQLGKIVIKIHPGMAFGTGTHATTQFALKMLKKLRVEGAIDKARVLDVGAGSGILSIAAEFFGAEDVTAIDIDPESWRECRRHFRLNRRKKCRVSEKPISHIQRDFDIVVANIIDGVLMDMRNDLWRKTKRGGYLLLSGILTVGSRSFEKAFLSGRNFRSIRRFHDPEWTALLIAK